MYSIYLQIEDSSHLDFVTTLDVMKEIDAVMKMVEHSAPVVQICVMLTRQEMLTKAKMLTRLGTAVF